MLFTDMLDNLTSQNETTIMTTEEFEKRMIESEGDVPAEFRDVLGGVDGDAIQTLIDQGLGFLDNTEVPGDNITHQDKMEMKKDPVVRFGLLLKKFSILGKGFDIDSPIQDENDDRFGEANEIRDFVARNLNDWIKGSFTNKLRRILSALDHGISISEKVWEITDSKVILKDIKTREENLHEFDLNKDEHGNLTTVEQTGVDEPIPISKLLIFSYLEEGQFLTGISDLEAAWDSWFRKKNIREFYSAFLELRSKINATAKFPGRDMDSQLAQSVWQMLKNLQLGGRMIIPENVETEIIEMSKSDANAFFKAIKYFDGQIMKAMVMPQLVSEASTEQANVGSFALGQKHFNIFVISLKYIKDQLEHMINDELVEHIVDMNFDTNLYPQFRINALREDSPQARAEILETMIEMDVVDPQEQWIREFVDVPEATDKSIKEKEMDNNSISEMAQELDEIKQKISPEDQLE